MFFIWKEFKFSASHVLNGLPDDHQCARLHGHNYTIEVELSHDHLDDTGFIVDFGQLKPIKEYIDNTFDHRHLNDVLAFNPTAENMAYFMYGLFKSMFPMVCAVRVKETDTSWAEYRAS